MFWNAQSLLPGKRPGDSPNRGKLWRLLSKLSPGFVPDLIFISETELVSADGRKKLPEAASLLPDYDFHHVPVADGPKVNRKKGNCVYVRKGSPHAEGGRLEVNLQADPYGAFAVWSSSAGVVIGGRMPVPRQVDLEARIQLECYLRRLLGTHGPRVLAVGGDLNVTLDPEFDTTR